jgi:hypothetical protein
MFIYIDAGALPDTVYEHTNRLSPVHGFAATPSYGAYRTFSDGLYTTLGLLPL